MNYYIGRFLFHILFKFIYRLKITGKENLPKGGFIIASNHNSLADPPLVGSSISSPVYFMAKRELFEIPFFGTVIKSTHAFPVNRKAPELSSIKKAINLLKNGNVLLVFPEGTRKSNASIHRGVALLAHKAGVPVVPSKIYNNDKILKLAKLRYVIGKPVDFIISPEKRATSRLYMDFSSMIMDRISKL